MCQKWFCWRKEVEAGRVKWTPFQGECPSASCGGPCDSFTWKLVTPLDNICLTSAGVESRVVHSGLGPVKQRNGKHPKSIFFRKKKFIVATKMQTHHFYMANWKTVQSDSSVRSQKTLRRPPPTSPAMHPHIHTPEKVLYQNTSLFLFVFIFVKNGVFHGHCKK